MQTRRSNQNAHPGRIDLENEEGIIVEPVKSGGQHGSACEGRIKKTTVRKVQTLTKEQKRALIAELEASMKSDNEEQPSISTLAEHLQSTAKHPISDAECKLLSFICTQFGVTY